MASALRSAAPPHAMKMWMDCHSIYMEIPGANGGPPYITSYQLCESGLSKALSMMRDIHTKAVPLGGSYQIPLNPSIKKINDFSKDQRATARAVLRKLGITG